MHLSSAAKKMNKILSKIVVEICNQNQSQSMDNNNNINNNNNNNNNSNTFAAAAHCALDLLTSPS